MQERSPILVLITSIAGSILLAEQTRRLPVQNVVIYGAAVAFVSLASAALAAQIGVIEPIRQWPNTPSYYVQLPFQWLAILLGARAIALRIVWPWNARPHHGWRVLATTWVLMQLHGFLFARAFTHGVERVSLFGVASPSVPVWIHFILWAVASLTSLMITTPLLLDKRTQQPTPPQRTPLAIALGMTFLLAFSAWWVGDSNLSLNEELVLASFRR